ncbi:hypothetical protein CNMCM5623_009665 [Aspergillus felis]|uniref:FAD-binding domain-containing protein n=1 Tax=Aspergillus felis TaxID=1287682 RepID=A0A8H6PKS3_9EURO|nr:hypothetical protein CNMCM5623_009665 [Aspergillus felis]
MNNHDWETTDILICGCGPTGALLSAYLGQMRISNVVLEKEANITTDPRGIALDEDGIRILQGVGLYDSIYTEIGSCMGKFHFISGSDTNLMKQPFVTMDYNTTAGGTGHVGYICHKQPALEKKLREAILASSTCSLRSESTVVDLKEDDNWTYCTYRNTEGTERKIRARFFVGADGKTGFTRKQYLEEKGVFMEKVTDIFYDETWVALNWEITLPTPQNHPDFPLWDLGYTPEQLFAVVLELPMTDFGDLSSSFSHMKMDITWPRVKWLPGDVQFPEDCINILRSRPFSFSARSCNVWAKNRVILCGDSAHVFPPFQVGGQGIASGFRDALSLAWRLAMLCRYHPSDTRVHHEVLRSWYLERKQQLEKSLAATIENGKFVTESQPLKALARDWRRDGMVRYTHTDGMPFIPELNGGLSLPQVYGKRTNGEVVFTDDIIFRSQQGALFHMFVYLHNSQEIQEIRRVLREVEQLSKGTIVANNVPIIVEELKKKEIEDCPNDIIQLATSEDFASSSLCNQRPKPMLYDPFIIGKEIRGRYCIVRPDRFIYAACNEIKDLREAIQKMLAYLHQT